MAKTAPGTVYHIIEFFFDMIYIIQIGSNLWQMLLEKY